MLYQDVAGIIGILQSLIQNDLNHVLYYALFYYRIGYIYLLLLFDTKLCVKVVIYKAVKVLREYDLKEKGLIWKNVDLCST